MVNINALGIIFPNTYDELVPQLVKHRTMASVPFGGRYRMIDFTLSGMVNSPPLVLITQLLSTFSSAAAASSFCLPFAIRRLSSPGSLFMFCMM